MVLGLLLGIFISFVVSGFEEVLSKNVQVAFFIPFIVYITDAIGTQTQTIYSRDLKTGRAKFSTYLRKEFTLGIIWGALFAVFSGAVAFIWLDNGPLALCVTAATFLAIAVAPIIALLVTQAFQSIRRDPAVGSGPITTVIQDMLSVLIYGIVCSIILL